MTYLFFIVIEVRELSRVNPDVDRCSVGDRRLDRGDIKVGSSAAYIRPACFERAVPSEAQ